MIRKLVLLALVACQSGNSGREPPPAAKPAKPGSAAPAPAAPAATLAPPAPPRPGAPALPDPLPGKRKDITMLVRGAQRAAIVDRKMVLVDAAQLRILELGGKELASLPAEAGINKLVTGDFDGDGKPEIFAGWGQSREHMSAKARVTMHRLDGTKLVTETVLEPETSRPEIVAIVPAPDLHAVLIAYFDSKYMVTITTAKRDAKGTWSATKLTSIRTVSALARGDVDNDGKPDLVVGRFYGDDQGSDGDAFVVAPDLTRKKIPSTRGMRTLAIIDNAIYLGDGWHQNYAANAHGLLSRSEFKGGAFQTSLIEDTPGQYALDKIVAASIAGKTNVIAVGNAYVRVYPSAGAALTIAGPVRDVAVGDLDGKPGDEILLIGEHSEVVSL